MDSETLDSVIALTGLLQTFRTIYITGTFAILGFVVQRNGYRTIIEKLVISFSFLFFGLGNLFQICQTSENIETLASGSWFKYLSPEVALWSHLPFNVLIFLVLMFTFKTKALKKTSKEESK